MKEYKRLSNEDLTDFTSRVVVQLEPTLTQQVMSLILELTEYRTKIENGTLIELPCKVGDKVYYVNEYRPTARIEEYTVYTFTFDFKHEIVLMVENGYGFYPSQVFLTKSEAEAKLKEIKEL